MICSLLIYPFTSGLGVKIKIFAQVEFQPPIETDFIELVPSVRSLMKCAAICDRHIVCRTADYNSLTKDCRLFETLTSAGNFTANPFRTILALDYCPSESAREPEYICSRSRVYSVQEILDRLNQSTANTLEPNGQSSYVNMHGIYVGTFNGTVLFFNFDRSKTSLRNTGSEITNINSAGRNGIMIVQYYRNETTVLNNNGTPWNPRLFEMTQFRVPGRPYNCFSTPQSIYITYSDSQILFSIHNRVNGSMKSSQNTSTLNYRPTIFERKDKIIVMDKDQMMEFNLNGQSLSYRNYSTSTNVSERNYFHYDYAGRLYLWNDGSDAAGVHVFVNNNTQIATGLRSVQIYITKEEVVSVVNSPTVMRKIEI